MAGVARAVPPRAPGGDDAAMPPWRPIQRSKASGHRPDRGAALAGEDRVRAARVVGGHVVRGGRRRRRAAPRSRGRRCGGRARIPRGSRGCRRAPPPWCRRCRRRAPRCPPPRSTRSRARRGRAPGRAARAGRAGGSAAGSGRREEAVARVHWKPRKGRPRRRARLRARGRGWGRCRTRARTAVRIPRRARPSGRRRVGEAGAGWRGVRPPRLRRRQTPLPLVARLPGARASSPRAGVSRLRGPRPAPRGRPPVPGSVPRPACRAASRVRGPRLR